MILTPWVIRLLLANIVVHVATMLAPQIVERLMFVPALVHLQPWTIVTYQFVHVDMMHLLFNMLSLLFFAPRLEMELGPRDFLLLYFISGIGGGLLSIVTPHTPIIGASGSMYGIMMAYALLWPRSQIFLWGLVPVEARWLVVFMTAMSLYGGFRGTDNIAHFAHLGGFVGGFFYIRWRRRSAFRTRTAPISVSPGPTRADLHRWMKIDRNRLHEVNREEFDRIQQKMREAGAGALTPTEIAFLDRFAPDEEP